jgi:hypothetical protein
MTSFVVVGEGEPVHAVLKTRSAQRAGNVVALFAASAMSSRLVNFAESQSIPVRSPGVLADTEAALLGINSEPRLASKSKQ